MPPKLSLKRKTESKPVAASEQPLKKSTETLGKSTYSETLAKPTKPKTRPKLRLTLAPYECVRKNKTKEAADQSKVAGYKWQPFPPSQVLREIYRNAHSEETKLN